MSVWRLVLATARGMMLTAALGTASIAFAQAQPSQASNLPDGPKPASSNAPANGSAMMVDYSKPRSHLFSFIGPYRAQQVSAPNFTNSARIDQVFRDGKIYLSLNDAIALALENNLDIAIARYNLPIADTDVLLSKAGAQTRGVNTGVVQNTPGGGVGAIGVTGGGGAGGTTTGAGGVGAGTGGIVTSVSGVGSPIGSYDPILTGTMQIERATTPQSNIFFTGVPFVNQNTTAANFGYNQSWTSGTTMNLSFTNDRVTTNNLRSTLSPILSSGFRFTMSQHLLQGWGLLPNERFIRIAKNNRRISDSAFRQQIRESVSQIQNIYWDLVSAYEDVKVKERALEYAQKTYSDNQKQVEIGTLAPIEVVRAQSQVSSAQQDLIVSRTNLQLQQLLMKNAISRSLGDPALATADVIPTDTMQINADESLAPVEDLVKTAYTNSPEIEQAKIDLQNRDITKRSARNALLPTLDAFAFYGATGLAGSQVPGSTCGQPGADPASCTPPGTFQPGYSDAFHNLFNSSGPDKGVGLQLTIPIRNRAAQANQVRSELEYRQAEMRMQQLFNTVSIQVRNAHFAVEQNRARVQAAVAGRELAVQSLDAEQKKYALGASTTTLVLNFQTQLQQAESTLVSALTAYEKSKVELDRVTSMTLERNRVQLAESKSGVVTTTPQVPGVVPISSDVNNPANPPVRPQQQQQPEQPAPAPTPQQ